MLLIVLLVSGVLVLLTLVVVAWKLRKAYLRRSAAQAPASPADVELEQTAGTATKPPPELPEVSADTLDLSRGRAEPLAEMGFSYSRLDSSGGVARPPGLRSPDSTLSSTLRTTDPGFGKLGASGRGFRQSSDANSSADDAQGRVVFREGSGGLSMSRGRGQRPPPGVDPVVPPLERPQSGRALRTRSPGSDPSNSVPRTPVTHMLRAGAGRGAGSAAALAPDSAQGPPAELWVVSPNRAQNLNGRFALLTDTVNGMPAWQRPAGIGAVPAFIYSSRGQRWFIVEGEHEVGKGWEIASRQRHNGRWPDAAGPWKGGVPPVDDDQIQVTRQPIRRHSATPCRVQPLQEGQGLLELSVGSLSPDSPVGSPMSGSKVSASSGSPSALKSSLKRGRATTAVARERKVSFIDAHGPGAAPPSGSASPRRVLSEHTRPPPAMMRQQQQDPQETPGGSDDDKGHKWFPEQDVAIFTVTKGGRAFGIQLPADDDDSGPGNETVSSGSQIGSRTLSIDRMPARKASHQSSVLSQSRERSAGPQARPLRRGARPVSPHSGPLPAGSAGSPAGSPMSSPTSSPRSGRRPSWLAGAGAGGERTLRVSPAQQLPNMPRKGSALMAPAGMPRRSSKLGSVV